MIHKITLLNAVGLQIQTETHQKLLLAGYITTLKTS